MSNKKKWCKLGKHMVDEEKFTTITTKVFYKKVDGTVSEYNHTVKRNQCNSCLHKRYKEKSISKPTVKGGSIVVGGILVY